MRLLQMPSPRYFTIAAVLLILGGMSPAAIANDNGLDLVLLIDVSRSMYTKNNADSLNPDAADNGSDPWRIRWDAVKLSLDLLTSDDRVFIGRFNDECPPPSKHPNGIKYGVYPKGNSGPDSQFDPARDEFPSELLTMTDAVRKRLESLTDLHNTRDDVHIFGAAPNSTTLRNGMDFGGTNILSALQLAKKILNQSGRGTAPGRRPHVLLLTDGLDPGMLRADGKTLNDDALKVLRELSQDGNGRVPISVHTLGLRICDLETASRKSARTLLRELSAKTQGKHHEIAGAHDLLFFFRDLVRDVKGYWMSEPTIATSATDPATVSFSTHAGAGLRDLSVMVYSTPKGTPDSPKTSLIAPQDFKPSWANADVWGDRLPGVPKALTGKGESLYRFIAFGPTSNDPSSPFAKLPVGQTAPLLLSLKAQPHDQHAVVFKRPVREMFSLEEPQTQIPWKRHASNFRIRVRMDESQKSLFRPENFRVTAEWRRIIPLDQPVESNDVDPLCPNANVPSPPDQSQRIALSRTAMEPWVFGADVCLDRLLPPRTSGVDVCELTIVLEGLTDTEHPLSDSRRKMPPVTLSVEHEPIPLEPLMSVTLTNGQPKQTVIVKPRGCLGSAVPLQMVFVPPGEEDSAPLDAKLFRVDADWSDAVTKTLELRPEGAAVTISLPSKDMPRPPAGKSYRPGRFEFSLKEDDGKWHRRLIVPVELQLDLIPIRFSGRPDTLIRSDVPQSSGALKLATVNPADAQHVTDLKVVLRPAPPDDDKAWKPAAFSEKELWIQTGNNTTPLEADQRKQQFAVKLDEPFRVWFLPSGKAERGRFQYELRIAGPGLTGTPVSGLLEVGQLQVERSDKEPVALFAEPGRVAESKFGLKLKGGLDAKEAVYVRGLDADQPESCVLTPKGKTEPQYKFELRGPTSAKPIELTTTAPRETEIVFQLLVPEDMPVGEYEGEFVVAGDGITTARVPIQLLIDQLQFQLPVDSPDGRQWVTTRDASERFVQFADREGHREIRVVRATGLTLHPKDLDPTLEGPFVNDLGEAQSKLPTISSAAADSNGEGAVLKLAFPKVTNFDSQRFAYRVKLWVRPAADAAKSFPAFLPVKGEFAVQYVRLPDLVPQEISP